jgi:hypothetical protein
MPTTSHISIAALPRIIVPSIPGQFPLLETVLRSFDSVHLLTTAK